MTLPRTVKVRQANAARTAVQAGPAWVIVEFIDAGIYDMSDRLFGASVLLLVLIFSYVMPIIENYSGRAIFRNPAQNVLVTTDAVKQQT